MLLVLMVVGVIGVLVVAYRSRDKVCMWVWFAFMHIFVRSIYVCVVCEYGMGANQPIPTGAVHLGI